MARKSQAKASKPAMKVVEKPSRSKARQADNGELFDLKGDEDGDNQFVKALGRGLDVLSAFKAGEGPLGNIELSERTGLPAPTVSRITYTLAQRGFLTFNRRLRMYELGGESFAIGRVAMANLDVRRLARPLMQALAAKTGFNVGLGTRDRHSMIYTDACEGGGLIGLRLFAGSRIPIATTAMGRAYVAGLNEDDRIALLRELKPRYPEWERILVGIERSIEDVRRSGFCVSLGEWQKEIHGVAVPIRTPESDQLFALNLGGPSYALPEAVVWNELGPELVKLARHVEGLMAV